MPYRAHEGILTNPVSSFRALKSILRRPSSPKMPFGAPERTPTLFCVLLRALKDTSSFSWTPCPALQRPLIRTFLPMRVPKAVVHWTAYHSRAGSTFTSTRAGSRVAAARGGILEPARPDRTVVVKKGCGDDLRDRSRISEAVAFHLSHRERH